MPDGRRIMIGWMQSWDSNIRPENQKWSGMMSLPKRTADNRWKTDTESGKRNGKLLC